MDWQKVIEKLREFGKNSMGAHRVEVETNGPTQSAIEHARLAQFCFVAADCLNAGLEE